MAAPKCSRTLSWEPKRSTVVNRAHVPLAPSKRSGGSHGVQPLTPRGSCLPQDNAPPGGECPDSPPQLRAVRSLSANSLRRSGAMQASPPTSPVSSSLVELELESLMEELRSGIAQHEQLKQQSVLRQRRQEFFKSTRQRKVASKSLETVTSSTDPRLQFKSATMKKKGGTRSVERFVPDVTASAICFRQTKLDMRHQQERQRVRQEELLRQQERARAGKAQEQEGVEHALHCRRAMFVSQSQQSNARSRSADSLESSPCLRRPHTERDVAGAHEDLGGSNPTVSSRVRVHSRVLVWGDGGDGSGSREETLVSHPSRVVRNDEMRRPGSIHPRDYNRLVRDQGGGLRRSPSRSLVHGWSGCDSWEIGWSDHEDESGLQCDAEHKVSFLDNVSKKLKLDSVLHRAAVDTEASTSVVRKKKAASKHKAKKLSNMLQKMCAIDKSESSYYSEIDAEDVRDPVLSALEAKLEATNHLLPFDALRLEEKIGQGAYSHVYAASYDGQRVAVKLLKNTKCKVRTFCREVAALTYVRNIPNTIPLVGASVFPLAIVTPYMPSGSLHDMIHEKGHKFSKIEALRLAGQIATAMKRMHGLNPPLLHRDITTRNIMYCNGQCYIADFGISRLGDKKNLPQTYSPIGHQRYRAPEVSNGLPYGKSADVYTFGTILYELFTLRRPFESKTDAQVLRIQKAGVQPVLPDTCPLAIQKLIYECWSNTPSDRPTFKKLASVLRKMNGAPEQYVLC